MAKATSTQARKGLDHYLGLPWTFVLVPDQESGFTIKVAELPGCMSQGETVEEAYAMIRDALEAWLSVALEDGQVIPEPGDDDQYSGKFQVRVPKSVHRKLAERAKAEDASLNLFCATTLARAVGE